MGISYNHIIDRSSDFSMLVRSEILSLMVLRGLASEIDRFHPYSSLNKELGLDFAPGSVKHFFHVIHCRH